MVTWTGSNSAKEGVGTILAYFVNIMLPYLDNIGKRSTTRVIYDAKNEDVSVDGGFVVRVKLCKCR